MATVYCKTLSADQVGFYMKEKGKDYFLCKQRYYKSLWDYFSGGVNVNSLFTNSGKHSYVIRELKRKLPAYVQYVEREEGVCVLSKTMRKGEEQLSRSKYRKSKMERYDWRKDEAAC